VSDAPLQPFAERLAAVFAAAGFPRMPARVLMTLVTAEGARLTAAELRERLGISAGAVSGAVRYLETVHMIRRLPHERSRREVYEVPDGAGWYTASLRATPVYDAIAALLPEGVAAATADGAVDVAARLEETARFFAFVRERLPMVLTEWEALREHPPG
jgi:hypothetical protein